MNDTNNILRNIPQVEKLLQNDEIASFVPEIGHSLVTDIIRKVTGLFRKKIQSGADVTVEKLVPAIVKNCRVKKLHKLQKVINCTGVIIHTNLGRSPLGKEIFSEAAEALSGYCNLEYQLTTGKRGKRGGFAEELICNLTSAEDALIVNNNASSVFLILNEFARGREAIVSRGELIQIGGGFRIPDIMNQSGARLVETGTTNITELDDFRNSITENTSMIFSAHQSNYKIEGFSRSPSLKELSELKNEDILLVRDLGSGNLVTSSELPANFEQTVSQELSQGADLVCFSGDKLLGGCQAGIIIGKKELIARLRKNPLMRMIRVDKITYYIIQETLLIYDNGEYEDIPLWSTIFQDKKTISGKITRLMRNIKHPMKKDLVKRVNTLSTYGGGTLPTLEVESAGVEIRLPGIKPDDLYTRMISLELPVVGAIIDDRYTLDFMTVFDDDIPYIASVIEDLLEKF
jgi:L-seryl-tRNA(Ser) seleniumtransferase